MTEAREAAIEYAVHDFVLTKARLGIYDPVQPRRPKVDVVSFEIELLEIDESDLIVHAAGPVILRRPEGGETERYLRISVGVRFEGETCVIPENGEIRAAYIVETEHSNGACKETAALANV